MLSIRLWNDLFQRRVRPGLPGMTWQNNDAKKYHDLTIFMEYFHGIHSIFEYISELNIA